MPDDQRAATSGIQVIDRASAILDAIARYREPVSLKILSAETGLHPSTTHRILASLTDNRLVERDPAGHYRLGRRLLQLSGRVPNTTDLRSIALPVMESLRDELGASINLTIREGDVVVYIAKATLQHTRQRQQLVGSRAPLHVTAVGKLMLGAAGAAEIRGYAQRTNLPAYTRNTISTLPRLLSECESAIKRGYAFDNEEAEIDVGCIGVLLYDGMDEVVAGLSVSAPIDRRRNTWVDRLRAAADRISSKLG